MDIILTQEGKQKLEEELHELQKVKMPMISKKIEVAKDLGDLSENAEYHDAKDRQGMMAARISEITEILKRGVVQERSGSKDKIELGSCFVVENVQGVKKEFTVVGFSEADPANGKISNVSPMGEAFCGASLGESVDVETPRGVIVYKVVEIK